MTPRRERPARRSCRGRSGRARRSGGRSGSARRRAALGAPRRRGGRRARPPTSTGRIALPSRARSQPRISVASARGPRMRISCSPMPGQQPASVDAPCQRARPLDVGHGRLLEELGELAVAQLVPLRRVDDEPVGDLDELLEVRRRRTAARRASAGTRGRSEIASGSTSEAGASARLPRRRSLITSPATVPSPVAKHRTESSTPSPEGSSGSGTRITVREGWRSSIPSSVRSAASSHSRRNPRDVRHHARPLVRLPALAGRRPRRACGQAAPRSPRSRRSRRATPRRSSARA